MAALLGPCIGTGCRASGTVAPGRHDPKLLDPILAELGLHTAQRSNDGRPFHVLVRAVTREQFANDDYTAVAKLVMAPDDSVIKDIVVFPGQGYRVDLELDEIPEGIGVYGLYTGPEWESWKTYVEWGDALDVYLGPASGVFAAADIVPDPANAPEGSGETTSNPEEHRDVSQVSDEEAGDEEAGEPNNVLAVKLAYSHALTPPPSEDGSRPDRPVGFILSYERVLLEDWLALEISKPFYFSSGRLDSPFEVFLKWNRRFGQFEPAIGVGIASNVRVFHSGRQIDEGVNYELSLGVAATTSMAYWFNRRWGLELEVNYGYIPLAAEVEHELNLALGPLFAF
ncbi:hypothetical protein [Enhygromyxa salina]|uniref:hypothetical protein n=1 Tax=Enhygromyxa salina TaxID=215803 RepID=UPI0011B2561A|nr:hypothetical protein [Enhygromyxa salina]